METDAPFEIATLALEAVVDPGRWGDLCDRIAERMGARAFMVLEYDLTRFASPHFHGSDAIRTVGADLAQAVMDGTDVEDRGAYARLYDTTPGTYATEREILGVPEDTPMPTNAWRDRVLQRMGVQSRSAMRLNEYGPFLDAAITHDMIDRARAEPEVAAFARAIQPMLARTIEAGRTIRALSDGYRRLMSLFDRLDFGAAFVDASGRIVLSNRTFQYLAAERDGLTDVGGVFGATGAADHGRVAAALRGTFDLRGARASTLTLSRLSGQLPLVVRLMPLRDRDVAPGRTTTLALVLDPEDDDRVSALGLRAFGLLSDDELALCELIVKGHPTEEIAERRGTALVRTEAGIAEATAKLACRSRLDVLRLAMATHLPVTPPAE